MGVNIKRVGGNDIVEAIRANDGYCVCAIEKTPDTKCMCNEFREIEEDCICHCGLYQKTIIKD